MDEMFYNCYSLVLLNLINFNYDKITEINNAFYNCHSLTILNIPSSKFKYSMFSNCNSLLYKFNKEIDFISYDPFVDELY